MNLTCTACGEATLPDARFCEACGADLDATAPAASDATGPACLDCGSGDIADGYCLVCGHKQPGRRDHIEIDLGTVAGVTDRGRRHHHNEDAMALAVVNGAAVMVVCDGVSTTDNPDVASQVAVDAALGVLSEAVIAGGDIEAAMHAAAVAAQSAVVSVPVGPSGRGNPSCTFVAAVVARHGSATKVTTGWLGDSRAYWIGPAPVQLTNDHSWANEMTAGGALTAAEAAADSRAGVITRWLGRDAVRVQPDIATATFEAEGQVLLCSDGLWNYAADPAELAVRAEEAGATLARRAIGLAAFALESGGHDNITVVVAQVPRPDPLAAEEVTET